MDAECKAILDAALRLPQGERMALVDFLLESLASEVNDQVDDEIIAELGRRFAEFQRDPSAAIPWSKLKDQD